MGKKKFNFNINKKLGYALGGLGALAVGGFLTAFSILKSPEIHKDYLRNKVGSKTVKITTKSERSGGTGFFVKAASGNTFILTNKHVCQVKNKAGIVYVRLENESQSVPRKVVAEYEKHDLCLVESFHGIEGIEVADNLEAGQTVGIVGHPKLFPLVLSKGEYIGETFIRLYYIEKNGVAMDRLVVGPVASAEVSEVEKKRLNFMNKFAPTGSRYVLKTYKSSQIVGYSRGGSSGSPIVDFYGNLVAVLYAGNRSDVMETYAVPLRYINDFLKYY